LALEGRLSPTRGTLVRLRTSLAFIQNGLSVLKLKRDRLAEELTMLLKETSRRDRAEEQLVEIYAGYKTTLASLGLSKVHSVAHSTGKMMVDVKERSVMNVMVPVTRIKEKPSTSIIQDASLFQVAEKTEPVIQEWLNIAIVEASIERIAYDLSLVNRKVNAIEKVVIPSYQTQVKYIEDYLTDEELEDFTRIKHLKSVSRGEKT
jgi:H(+)-transporting ATP synthase subunit D